MTWREWLCRLLGHRDLTRVYPGYRHHQLMRCGRCHKVLAPWAR